MRITDAQINAIKRVIQKYLVNGHGSKLFLFGSRVDDSKRGGDYDFLLLLSESVKSDFQQNFFKVLAEIKLESEIGQQKIDLILATEEDLKQKPFLKSISSQLIEIAKFN